MQLLNVDVAAPTARMMPPGVVAGMALATAPAIITVLTGGSNLSGAAAAASLVVGALFGFAIDDPATSLLEASPTPLVVRRLHRAVALLLLSVAVAGVVAVVVVVAHDGPTISLAERAREGAAAAGLAVAAAAWLTRRTGEPRPGRFGLLVGLLGPVLVSALSLRVEGLPCLGSVGNASRWWWLAILGWGLAVWWSRDPARG